MKTTTYYILINIKTADGFESIGKFFIGNNKAMSYALFHLLKGSSEINDDTVLTMELMETVHQLPLNLQIIGCTLEELADNCRIITKETFRNMNLEEL